MASPGLKAPFIYFGGKRQLAPLIWRGLGDPDLYVEPFGGSLAVLLNRPLPPERWGRVREHCNDSDGYVANFWRALRAAPEEVASWADNPVHELDLTARHVWLVERGPDLAAKLEADPDFYDAKAAGWWVWGISNWIGGGWCSGGGPWQVDPETGTLRKRPHLTSGQGVNRQLPFLGGGRGVMLAEWFALLAARLEGVRCCAGDWTRVLTDGATSGAETVGVFLDPPYGMVDRSETYNQEVSPELHPALESWCRDHADRPGWRIAVSGYEGDFELPGWQRVAWKARRSMGRASGETRNSENRSRERVWFSPGCVGGLGRLVGAES